MTRFRRLAALVSGVLLLQLVLVGSGYACVMPAMGAMHAAAAGASMPGMDAPSGLERAAPAQAPSSDDSPCQLPWAPGTCQPMAPCTPAVVASARFALTIPHPAASLAVALVVLAPPSRSTPPDSPPPRA